MRAQALLAALIATIGAWPFAAPAQAQPARLPTIGFLGASSASGQAEWTAAFVERLRELGWIEGQTVRIEYRWAEGRNERFAEFADEFVRLNVDVILTDGGATLAAKRVTSAIPIVFAVAADPLGGGYVASLARPGGNVTGSSVQASDTAGKRLGLLREALPDLTRVAVLVNPSYPATLLETRELEAAADKLGIEVVRAEIRKPGEIAPAINAVKDRAEALYVCTDSFANSNRAAINAAALAAGLPTMQGFRDATRAGGLMSYGANFPALFRRAAEKVDMILRGAKPGDLPVEQPSRFDLVINLKTAETLGVNIPAALYAAAEELIE
jgi:putative ABC transport system substrate-binding protein